MKKSGLLVPVAALLSGIVAAGAAAQQIGPGPRTPPPYAGNPLWAISVDRLSATLARPLFSPSRRPPAPPVVAALSTPTTPAPLPKHESDHPLLTLLGTIVGQSMEIGVFVDEASHDVIRLKAGEAHHGWTLYAVAGRTAIFHKDGDRAATLALPGPGGEQIGGVAPADALEPQVTPSSTKGGAGRPPRAS